MLLNMGRDALILALSDGAFQGGTVSSFLITGVSGSRSHGHMQGDMKLLAVGCNV